jgi:glycosyltransferase involved in cell wall biosynthesis
MKSVNGQPVDIWDGKFTREAVRNFSISLCTTCMGRLNDLVQTLPKNIADNATYPNLQFVLLDYNSNDGMESWVKENMGTHIESGRLVYGRTKEPKWYHMAHSRNVAFKLATGEIVCNVDADNWTGPGFADALNRLANEQPEHAVFVKGWRLLRGRVGLYRKEWMELVGGYDESLTGYGHDDRDMVDRALLQGFRLMWFGSDYVTRIKTGRGEKVANMEIKNWKATETANKARSTENIAGGILKSNQGREWGKAVLRVNFKEEVIL